jgi:tyrosine-protein phosphatase YwqE
MALFRSSSGKANPAVNKAGEILGVDMHSHLIPGIDDGAQSLDESISLIRNFQELGYRKLIITPHVNERFPNPASLIRDKFELLKARADEEKLLIQLEIAAEYQVGEYFEQLFKNKDLLTFGDQNLLIECSYYLPYPAFSILIYELQLEGYNLILAHPERYVYWHDKFREYEKLRDRDVKFQINMSSLSGQYTKAVRNVARKFIENDWVDFIGSDVHNHHYLKLFREGLEDKYTGKLLSSSRLKNNSL